MYRSAVISLHGCFLLDSCDAISLQLGEARQICWPFGRSLKMRLLWTSADYVLHRASDAQNHTKGSSKMHISADKRGYRRSRT
jgi:hypothetical protein